MEMFTYVCKDVLLCILSIQVCLQYMPYTVVLITNNNNGW